MTIPLRSVRYGIRGLPSDLLVWTQTSTTSTTITTSPIKPKLIVVFICGNPGLPNYYTPFLSLLHSILSPTTTRIYALGHLGHTKSNKNKNLNSIANLNEQVMNQIELLDELTTEFKIEAGKEGSCKLVTVAHSIGSWISLEILKQRPNLITSLNFLFPTISDMALTPNGRKLSLLFTPSLRYPLSYLTGSLHYLPSKLIRPIISIITSQRGPALEVTESLITSSETVSATVTMGAEEMKVVASLAVHHEVLKNHGGRIRWYWASEKRDSWVLESSVVEIEEYLDQVGDERWKSKRMRCEEGMEHAFVLNDGHVESLARKIGGWVIEDTEF